MVLTDERNHSFVKQRISSKLTCIHCLCESVLSYCNKTKIIPIIEKLKTI